MTDILSMKAIVSLLIMISGLLYFYFSMRTITKSNLSVRECMPKWMVKTMAVSALIPFVLLTSFIADLFVENHDLFQALGSSIKSALSGLYIFLVVLQGIPFAFIWLGLAALSVSRRDYLNSAFWGGYILIMAVIIVISGVTVEPMFTQERASSTHGLAMLVIPFLGVPAGALGMLLGVLVRAGIRRSRNTEQTR